MCSSSGIRTWPDDFAGSEIADQAELRGEAELAIDGAAGLCGNADGLAAVAGHEHGFDAGGASGGAIFAGWKREEIAHRAVGGVVALANDGSVIFVSLARRSRNAAGSVDIFARSKRRSR